MEAYREITPLTQDDLFVILHTENDGFNYPIHYHSAYELTLVLNSSGNRLVGDSVEKYDLKDLVLIGPKIYHKWDDDDMPPEKKNSAQVITIQFSEDLFNQPLFQKKSFYSIMNLLKSSHRGMKFTSETFTIVSEKIKKLTEIKGFDAFIEFLKILQILSLSKNIGYLTREGFPAIFENKKGDRVNEMYKYILNHYNEYNFRITELAKEHNMSPSGFGHFFKKCTNKSFTQFIVNMRLSHATKLLLNSDFTISEIAYRSGFNNIANFNRLFKKNKFCTPKQFKQNLMKSNKFDWREQITPNQFLPFNKSKNKL